MILDFLLSSGLSQAALFLSILLAWQFLTRTPDLAGRLAHVREYVSKRKRVSKARAFLERARAERTSLQKVADRTRQLLRDRIEIADPQQLATAALSLAVVTVVLFEGDTLLMTLLNGGSSLFGLGFQPWAIGSPWIVAAIFTGMHMLIAMALVDPDRPARTLRLAKRGALVSGVVLLIALWGSLSGRGVDFASNGWAADTIQWSLWILALMLATCGAFTAVIASEQFGQSRSAARLVELESRDEEYGRHIAALEREIQMHDDEDDVTPTKPSIVDHATRVAMFLLVVTLGSVIGTAGSALAAQPSPTANSKERTEGARVSPASANQAPQWATDITSQATGQCDVMFDVSLSIGPSDKEAAARALADSLPSALDVQQCLIVRLSAFSGNTPFQRLREYTLPALPKLSECAVRRVETVGGVAGLAKLMYPALKDTKEREAVQRCTETRQSEATAAAEPRAAAIGNLAAAVASLYQDAPVGNCTALYQAAARALTRSQHVTIATDGEQSCTWYRKADGSSLALPVPEYKSLVFLLIPSARASERTFERAAERASTLQAVFPGSIVQLLNEATHTFWSQLRAAGK